MLGWEIQLAMRNLFNHESYKPNSKLSQKPTDHISSLYFYIELLFLISNNNEVPYHEQISNAGLWCLNNNLEISIDLGQNMNSIIIRPSIEYLAHILAACLNGLSMS